MMGALASLLRVALQDGGVVEGATSPALLDEADALATALAAHRVAPDEPVHLMVGRGAADLAGLLGIWMAGGVAVPVHASAVAATTQALLAATGARLIVAASVAVIRPAAPPTRPLLRGAALIVFTSGTTGRPKGVVIGHDALAGKIDVLGRLLPLSPADVVLSPLRLTFIFGLWVALLALRSGARLLLTPKVSIDMMTAQVARETTVLAAVPSMLRMLHAGTPPAPGDLRTVWTGGEALGPALATRIGQHWPGVALMDLYGSTETGSCDFAHRAGPGHATIGHATEGVQHRFAADGELCIRTPFGMAGYLDDPGQTDAAFVDGFFRTGDLARIAPDGSVALIGRSKEIVSRGGNKIAPQEIDDLLSAHPGVAAALSTGLPDERLGETLHAVVVPLPGAVLSPEAVRVWIAGRTERFKVPDSIRIVDALPSGPTGKASRPALRTLLST